MVTCKPVIEIKKKFQFTSSQETRPLSPAAKLLQWYHQYGRDLPWRRTRDPYRILVSEIMLQQTQVNRVKVYYRAWLRQFPSWKKLASASNAQVIHAWAGLGYNRRALMLRDVARFIIAHGLPQSEAEWRVIKGIGPYTAAAIRVFAQGQRTLPIDTNIRRVLGRLLLGKPFPTRMDDEWIRVKTNAFLPRRGAYCDIPQAIFDLATAICVKRPNCAKCPLKDDCPSSRLFLSGRIKVPKRTIATARERRHRDKSFPDRIYRGRILKLVREQGWVTTHTIGRLIDPRFDRQFDQTWVEAMVDRLVRDGMLSRRGTKIILSPD